MQRFVTRKIYKVPRYKLLHIMFFLSIVLIIVLKIIIDSSLKKINQEKLLNLVVGNSYGNILSNYNIFNYKYNIFYRNIYGFDLYSTTPVINRNDNITELIIDTKPIIYIYNTFQTDKYVNDYYSSYSINPVVTQASLILQEYLKTNNINSLVEKNSVAKILNENNIDYAYSYKGSRILLEQAKKENNSLEYFLDLGMSDDGYESTTVNINNVNYAKILFIVGTDNANYELNQELAKGLNKELELINENLSRGISLRGGVGYQGVYNQDFSSNTLLIYVGGKQNSIEEVNRSLKILAEVISNYLKGIDNEKK